MTSHRDPLRLPKKVLSFLGWKRGIGGAIRFSWVHYVHWHPSTSFVSADHPRTNCWFLVEPFHVLLFAGRLTSLTGNTWRIQMVQKVQRFSGKKAEKMAAAAAIKLIGPRDYGYSVVRVAPGTITKHTSLFKMDGNGNGYSQPFPM